MDRWWLGSACDARLCEGRWTAVEPDEARREMGARGSDLGPGDDGACLGDQRGEVVGFRGSGNTVATGADRLVSWLTEGLREGHTIVLARPVRTG
jgi:hypothetical protein